jgi:hypothetical protein
LCYQERRKITFPKHISTKSEELIQQIEVNLKDLIINSEKTKNQEINIKKEKLGNKRSCKGKENKKGRAKRNERRKRK